MLQLDVQRHLHIQESHRNTDTFINLTQLTGQTSHAHNHFFLLKNHIMAKTMVTMTPQIIAYPQCQRNSGM
jgi:hypothetical protein